MNFRERAKPSPVPSIFFAAVSTDDNPLTCADDRLRHLAVELTIVGGRIVYDGRRRP